MPLQLYAFLQKWLTGTRHACACLPLLTCYSVYSWTLRLKPDIKHCFLLKTYLLSLDIGPHAWINRCFLQKATGLSSHMWQSFKSLGEWHGPESWNPSERLTKLNFNRSIDFCDPVGDFTDLGWFTLCVTSNLAEVAVCFKINPVHGSATPPSSLQVTMFSRVVSAVEMQR